ncbi:hypothetical protein D3C75_1231400 [compost metagenome]
MPLQGVLGVPRLREAGMAPGAESQGVLHRDAASSRVGRAQRRRQRQQFQT